MALFADIGTVLAAAFTGWAAHSAWRAAKGAEAQGQSVEQLQREQAIDAQWMRYQDYYRDCIPLFDKYPGMPRDDYLALTGQDQRRLHLAAVALLQTLDLAYRAKDEFRAGSIRRYLENHEGPLATPNAINSGVLMHRRTFADWNAIRDKHGQPRLPAGESLH
jgi:hypothetical protein